MIEIIKNLTRLGTRQGIVAKQASGYLCRALKENGVPFSVEGFKTFIPVMKKAELVIDGKKQPCVGCGMASGEIPTTNIASSLMSSKFLIDTPVIYCNPMCKAVSPTNFSFAPAIGIAPRTLMKLLKAKNSRASLKVEKKSTQCNFLLVGNTKNPKTIVFSHYDSLGPGAIDNASGTAVALDAAITLNGKSRLGRALFVFDGNEEISYDHPTYWGHGYRVFEGRYFNLLKKARRVIVVDCVGQGKSTLIRDSHIINLAFPLKNIPELREKVSILSGDIELLMPVYHSKLDLSEKLTKKGLKQAKELLLQQCLR